jgi:ribose-phosphate pyrophosphokinase
MVDTGKIMLYVLGNNLSGSFRDYFNTLATTRKDFTPLPVSVGQFRSHEPFSELKADPKGQDVVVFQSTSGDVSASCMELLLTVATLKRYGAKSVTVAIPFAAFGRQDKLESKRFESVAADEFPKLLKAMGADKIITAEVHSKKAEQCYINHFGVENVVFIYSAPLVASDIRTTFGALVSNAIVLGADGGDKPNDSCQIRASEVTVLVHGLNPATVTPQELDALMAKIWKAHEGVNATKVVKFEGNVAGKFGILVDDMTDSAGTGLNGGETLKDNGATSVTAYIFHGLCDIAALKDVLTAVTKTGVYKIDQLVVTDSAPGILDHIETLRPQYPDIDNRIRVMPTAPLFAEKIFNPAP